LPERRRPANLLLQVVEPQSVPVDAAAAAGEDEREDEDEDGGTHGAG
jgi:hypothetical protein